MEIWKKWISIMCTLLLTFSLLSPAAMQAEQSESELTEVSNVVYDKAALEALIEQAEKSIAGVQKSIDGQDIDASAYWVTEEIYNRLATQIAYAKI